MRVACLYCSNLRQAIISHPNLYCSNLLTFTSAISRELFNPIKTVRFFASNSSQTAKPSAIMAAGFASFEGQVLEQVELIDEEDGLNVEVLLLQDITKTEIMSFGKAVVPLPKDGASQGHDLTVTSKDGSRRVAMHVKMSWVE